MSKVGSKLANVILNKNHWWGVVWSQHLGNREEKTPVWGKNLSLKAKDHGWAITQVVKGLPRIFNSIHSITQNRKAALVEDVKRLRLDVAMSQSDLARQMFLFSDSDCWENTWLEGVECVLGPFQNVKLKAKQANLNNWNSRWLKKSSAIGRSHGVSWWARWLIIC